MHLHIRIRVCVYVYYTYTRVYQLPLNSTQYNIPTSWTQECESPPTRKYMENNSDTAGDLCDVQGLIHGNLPEPRPSEWIARHEITWRTMRLALPLTSRALLTIVAPRARFTNFFPDFFFFASLSWERAQLALRLWTSCGVFRIDRAAFRASCCESTKFGKTACSDRIHRCAKIPALYQ